MTEAPRIVVAGVASLTVALPVEGFPVPEGRGCFPEWMEAGVSGVGADVALALAALGGRVELCTVIGSDAAGEAVRAELRAAGLLGTGCLTGGGSSLGVSMSAPDGRRRSYSRHEPVNRAGYPVPLFEHLVQGADLVALTTAAFTRPLLGPARRSGAPVAVDAQLIADAGDPRRADWLDVADVVFCSHERLPCSPEEWIGRIFAEYPGCAIAAVGRGEQGASMGLADGTLVHAATEPPRPVVSPVGAGDVLFASFLHAWLSAGNPARALTEAVVHASYAIGEAFPSRGHLTAADLRALTDRHPVDVTTGRWR
ncbi:carbohydrate kinase family protein [Nocardiopsis potens]|uniref:carbohydrate kinase family protein n=1 Tax=Nocardiopsis potens TaxID=1246458 RepID=UPI000349A52D|nr:PfkB family carbohydrate kinase [Nocardiopsis potens]